MRLYMRCHHCNHKTSIDGVVVESRIIFAQQIHSKHLILKCAQCGTCETYSVNKVYAEGSTSIIGPAMLIIGLFTTLFIGPIGLLLGGLAGAALAAGWKSAEATYVRKFNTSVVI